MYYERHILPIDKDGGFLLAVHYPQFRIGGDITRESTNAYFAYGNINNPAELTDITSLCCPPRTPSKKEALFYKNIADGQRMLVNQYEEGTAYRRNYQRNEWMYDYQAELAMQNVKFVPRIAKASYNGLLAISLDIEDPTGGGKDMVRVIDIRAGKVLAEKSINKGPQAIAVDGSAMLVLKVPGMLGAFGGKGIGFAEVSIPRLKQGKSLPRVQHGSTFYATEGAWLAIDEKISFIEYGTGKLQKEFPLPKGAMPWNAQLSQDGRLIAFAGDKGQVILLELETGNVRRFFPHRGCKRDDMLKVSLSSDGGWLASKVHDRPEMMITRLNDGVSWPVGKIDREVIDEQVEGEFCSQSVIPAAFSFIGSRLLVSESRSVQEINIEEPEDSKSMFVSEQGRPGARVPIKIPAKPSFDKLIKAGKLDRVAEEIRKYYSPSVKITTNKSKKSGWSMPGKRGAPDLGVSRFGGWPDMPANMDWPMWQNRPMSFLAQLNLDEVHAAQPDTVLPRQGVLLFFLGCDEEHYENATVSRETYMVDIMLGSESTHREGWKVIYAAPSASLQRTVYEANPAPDMFSPCMLRLSRGKSSLPDENAAPYENIAFNEAERENYNEILDLLAIEEGDNQLMGYPSLLQFTPLDMQCELAASGKDPFRFPEKNSDEYKELVSKASEWTLLLQLTSDESPGFLWGDAGQLYFYGKRGEIEAGDFSTIWVSYEN